MGCQRCIRTSFTLFIHSQENRSRRCGVEGIVLWSRSH
ncbi:hypothetical protein E1A91_A11G238600v1 [Gossypium mustelinum]|uniref:Uncharacterized protein n=1 Tax=Gossypium mustelinum TaxID=34275 RepID=A0A5D2XAQ9_GOSMU|nr:hypothetical protein E1A91_A11G238600v1 [Gossypium mustelinum]